ncbi:EF-hand domain-containing protein [Streptomyces gamaensis]|uniref:EF-hand domain-containing protein n=1 Tax=Streptomyces gamaensis TaxID=1763542 RepID=A0ABW0Z569_9ACTN
MTENSVAAPAAPTTAPAPTTAAADRVLRERYARRFRVLDADGDGLIREADLLGRARRLADGLGEPPGSPRAVAALRGARAFWRGVTGLAGVAADGRLTEDEFVAALDEARQLGGVGELLRPAVRAHVALVDRDGDGHVDREEFTRAQQALGIPAGSARDAFARLDRDGDGRITVEAWQRSALAFYTDPGDGAGELVVGTRP